VLGIPQDVGNSIVNLEFGFHFLFSTMSTRKSDLLCLPEMRLKAVHSDLLNTKNRVNELRNHEAFLKTHLHKKFDNIVILPGWFSRKKTVRLALVNELRIRPENNVNTGLFWDVPNEVLLCILEFLPPIDLLRLSQTCSKLFFASSCSSVWKSLMERNHPKLIAHRPNKMPWKQWYLRIKQREIMLYYAKSGEYLRFDLSLINMVTKWEMVPGDRVMTPRGPAIVIGECNGHVWFHCDCDNGASYWDFKSSEELFKNRIVIMEHNTLRA